jgi:hypothetical protein
MTKERYSTPKLAKFRKLKLIQFSEQFIRNFALEAYAKLNFYRKCNGKSAGGVGENISQLAKDFDKNGVLKYDSRNLGMSQELGFTLESIPDENVFSSLWDEVNGVETVVQGRDSRSVFQQTFQLPEDWLNSMRPCFLNSLSLLSHLKKMTFDLTAVNTYRFFPTEFKDFQSYMWHIDFVSYSQHEYKFMLFLEDCLEDNGPMLVSDIMVSRRFRLKRSYRISEDYVRRHASSIRKCTGNRYEGYFFDTKMVHKGGRVVKGVRDVCVLSFRPGSGEISNFIQDVPTVGSHSLCTKVTKGWF